MCMLCACTRVAICVRACLNEGVHANTQMLKGVEGVAVAPEKVGVICLSLEENEAKSCRSKHLDMATHELPDGTSCLCAERPAVLADGPTQHITQGMVTELQCRIKMCVVNGRGQIGASGDSLRGGARGRGLGGGRGGREGEDWGEESTVDSGLEIAQNPAPVKEPDETEGSVVGEQECARAQEVDPNVGVGKEVSVDADKAYTAVAPSSELAETTMGDEWNKQKKQKKKEEEKKQQQQERKKRKEEQQDKKKQLRGE